jgi:hypothetical protein
MVIVFIEIKSLIYADALCYFRISARKVSTRPIRSPETAPVLPPINHPIQARIPQATIGNGFIIYS